MGNMNYTEIKILSLFKSNLLYIFIQSIVLKSSRSPHQISMLEPLKDRLN